MIREEKLRDARILAVDDQEANLVLLQRMLDRAGHTSVRTTTDSTEVLDLVEEIRPDLLLLDLQMPSPDGFEILGRLEEVVPEADYLPVLVLTADDGPDVKHRALTSGAKDFLTKPFDYAEVLLRIRNLLTTRFLHLDLRGQNERLDEKVRERTRALEEARLEALERLARAAEFRDDATGQHTRRVGEASGRVARALGLDERQVELIRLAAPLHDIGKIGIPDAILLKPGRLTPPEMEVMKTHAEIGGKLLSDSSSALMQVAEVIARHHHERWNGEGYPDGLSGERIPLPARIVSVVDVFDALSYDRPYRPAWAPERVLEEIAGESGERFDPRLVEVFLSLLEEDGLPVPDRADLDESDLDDRCRMPAPAG